MPGHHFHPKVGYYHADKELPYVGKKSPRTTYSRRGWNDDLIKALRPVTRISSKNTNMSQYIEADVESGPAH